MTLSDIYRNERTISLLLCKRVLKRKSPKKNLNNSSFTLLILLLLRKTKILFLLFHFCNKNLYFAQTLNTNKHFCQIKCSQKLKKNFNHQIVVGIGYDMILCMISHDMIWYDMIWYDSTKTKFWTMLSFLIAENRGNKSTSLSKTLSPIRLSQR